MNAYTSALILGLFTCLLFVGCGGPSIDEDIALPDLSSAQAQALCEDVENAGPMTCNDEGENEKDLTFDVSDCQNQLKERIPEGCTWTVGGFYEASTGDACASLAKVVACLNGK